MVTKKFSSTTKHGTSLVTIGLSILLLALIGYLFFSGGAYKADLAGKKIVLSLEEAEMLEYETSQLIEEKEANMSDASPIIAIFLNDFGLNKANSDLAANLPNEIAFGISVYNPSEYQGSSFGVHDNRNILLNIPMSPIDYSDNHLLKPLSPKDSPGENMGRLDNFLNFFMNYQGVYSDEFEIYTKDPAEAMQFLSILKEKSLIYLCGLTNKNATLYKEAEKIDFHILSNDVILDDILSYEAINNKLKELETIAVTQGYALAKASQYQLTIEALNIWLPSLLDKNIKLVSIEEYYTITKQRRKK